MKFEELKEWLESTIIDCKQLVDAGYHKVEKEIPFYEECLKVVNYQLAWINPEKHTGIIE